MADVLTHLFSLVVQRPLMAERRNDSVVQRRKVEGVLTTNLAKLVHSNSSALNYITCPVF